MCWPFKSSSGSTSGYTRTIISQSICLVKEQTIDATYHQNDNYTHKDTVYYRVYIVTKYSDNTEHRSQLFGTTKSEDEGNNIFNFAVKSNGARTISETIKEAKIKI